MLAVVTLLCPSVREDVRAAENQTAESQVADVPVSAGGDSLAISVSNSKINLVADPAVDGGVAQSTIDISVKTTNTSGYTLKVSTPDATSMRSTDTTNSATIQTITSNATLVNFPVNSWGYYVGDAAATASSTFRPFSTTAAEVDATTTANSTLRTKKMTIAAKVGASLPAAVYSGDVMVSAVGNVPKTSFGSIVWMQEMTSSVCSWISTDTEGTLTDSRDGNIYHVGKMKDGRCWMLQNLALGSTTGTIELVPADSNVKSNWTMPKAYTNATLGTASDKETGVWNFGKWVLATPLLATDCGNSGNIPTLASCIKAGLVNVSDDTKFKPTFTAQTATWKGANATTGDTLVAVNCTSWSGSGTSKKCVAGTYDEHYLVGNYYQWNTAVAGTGTGIDSGVASSSICPRGWVLPAGYGSGSYANLLKQYGIQSEVSGTIGGITYNIAEKPLSFVRAGFVSPKQRLQDVGLLGRYWTTSGTTPASGNTEKRAYYLELTKAQVRSNDVMRYLGHSVRCVNNSSI